MTSACTDSRIAYPAVFVDWPGIIRLTPLEVC
jgi:hypothetical protein